MLRSWPSVNLQKVPDDVPSWKFDRFVIKEKNSTELNLANEVWNVTANFSQAEIAIREMIAWNYEWIQHFKAGTCCWLSVWIEECWWLDVMVVMRVMWISPGHRLSTFIITAWIMRINCQLTLIPETRTSHNQRYARHYFSTDKIVQNSAQAWDRILTLYLLPLMN